MQSYPPESQKDRLFNLKKCHFSQVAWVAGVGWERVEYLLFIATSFVPFDLLLYVPIAL